jgi:hypothetical protein
MIRNRSSGWRQTNSDSNGGKPRWESSWRRHVITSVQWRHCTESDTHRYINNFP